MFKPILFLCRFCRFSFIAFLGFTILLSIIIMPSTAAYSAQVTLAWDANTESDIAGYRLYYGFESRNYLYSIDVGNQLSYTLSDLEPNQVYYYAATAYDIDHNESDFSEEIVYVVPAGNLPPVADAGPDQAVKEGATVTLNGSNSTDPNNDIVSYFWEQIDGPVVQLSNPGEPSATFTAPDVGPDGASLSFRLTVTDNYGLQSEDYCIVNISWENIPPTANAGPDQSVVQGYTVTLNGDGSSDSDDGIASYLWEQTGGPAVALFDSTGPQSTFIAPDIGAGKTSLTFQLTVVDFGGLRSTDTCVVNVSWTNMPPTANAGPDQVASPGDQITLDGSGSTDPDDGIVSYRWTQKSGTPVTLVNPLAVRATFVLPLGIPSGESLVFSLAVTDRGGLLSQDECVVNLAETTVYEDAEDGKTY